jgi:hypothetical protein
VRREFGEKTAQSGHFSIESLQNRPTGGNPGRKWRRRLDTPPLHLLPARA